MADLTLVPRAIVALDVPKAEDALALVDRLGAECEFYKVGSELFSSAGPDIVHRLVSLGKDVFLDLKFHDIPNTVRAAARSAAAIGARLITVHASGGRAMLEAAVDGAGADCKVLGVTVLTSLDAPALASAWGRSGDLALSDEVLRLAGDAAATGCAGVVCGGPEIGLLRERFGERLELLVPGIRLAGGAAHDQSRVVTPAAAAAAGATYLILGRAVTAAPDPVAAMREARRQINSGVGAGVPRSA